MADALGALAEGTRMLVAGEVAQFLAIAAASLPPSPLVFSHYPPAFLYIPRLANFLLLLLLLSSSSPPA